MDYYPICLDIQQRKCVVVGGGRVADRKVRSLLACGAQVTVVSPELSAGLRQLQEDENVTILQRKYRHGDLAEAFLVIAATNDTRVQDMVRIEAEAGNTLLNVADVPEKCNFILPAQMRRGALSITVSTSGKSPAFARKLRKELEKEYGEEYGKLVDVLGVIRPVVMGRGVPQKENEAVFQKILETDLLERIVAQDVSGLTELLVSVTGCTFAEDVLTELRGVVAA